MARRRLCSHELWHTRKGHVEARGRRLRSATASESKQRSAFSARHKCTALRYARQQPAATHAFEMATVHGWVSRERVRGFSRVLRHAFDRLVRSGRAEELMGGQQAAAAEGARPTARTRDVRSYNEG